MTTAKEQLATGKITIVNKKVQNEKQVKVPKWLFDLASKADSDIFNHEEKDQVEKMSSAMFTGLLIKLKAENR